MNDLPKAHPAGGVATQTGINHQNRVAAALAMACIAEDGWNYADQVSRGVQENVLVITNESFDGAYQMDLSVSVSETFVDEAAVEVDFSLIFEAERIVYESSYYADGAK
jgi:hypothetical protein